MRPFTNLHTYSRVGLFPDGDRRPSRGPCALLWPSVRAPSTLPQSLRSKPAPPPLHVLTARRMMYRALGGAALPRPGALRSSASASPQSILAMVGRTDNPAPGGSPRGRPRRKSESQENPPGARHTTHDRAESSRQCPNARLHRPLTLQTIFGKETSETKDLMNVRESASELRVRAA